MRHSGGVSTFIHKDIPATKLNVKVPDHLEVLWVSVRPKWLPRSVSNIIICGIYYPGSNSIYAPPQEELVTYLTESVQKFMNKYTSPLFMLMGDFNDMNIDEICKICRFEKSTFGLVEKNQNCHRKTFFSGWVEGKIWFPFFTTVVCLDKLWS